MSGRGSAGEHSSQVDVVVVGAGLSGLACATELTRLGCSFAVLEAAPAVGGRVRTDVIDGFRIDHGFQVLQTAYPEARRLLDYQALGLQPLDAGARVVTGGRRVDVIDPRQRPLAALRMLSAPFVRGCDLRAALRLRREVLAVPTDQLFEGPVSSTRDRLQEWGFSDGFIRAFFEPFLGGVFFDRSLTTSSHMADFVLQMFASGPVALPAGGMQAIPEQLAAALPSGSIHLEQPVDSVAAGEVRLQDGGSISCRAVVVAVDGATVSRWFGGPPPAPGRSALTLHLSSPEIPADRPLLWLDGDGEATVNNACVLDHVAPTYAPAGASLLSATVLVDGTEPRGTARSQLVSAATAQMSQWFGVAESELSLLDWRWIPHALPDQSVAAARPTPSVPPGVFACGDWQGNASIHGAFLTGTRAAKAAAEHVCAA